MIQSDVPARRRPDQAAPKVLLGLNALLLVAASVGSLSGQGSPLGKAYAFNVVAAVTFTALGALILPRQPGNSVGRLFAGIAFASAVVVLSASFSSHRPMEWFNQWSPAVVYGLFPLLLLLFPDGQLPSRAWRPVAMMACLGVVVGVTGMAVAAADVPGLVVDPDAPRTSLALAAMRISRVGLVAVVVSLVAAVVSLVIRYRRADGDTRQQLKWLAVGGAMVILAVLVETAGVPYVAEVVAAAAVPAAATLAILRYRLYDVDLFINRSAAYAGLTVLFVGGYVAVVTAVGALVSDRTSWIPHAIAAGAVAFAFAPLRGWLQRRANRVLYGDRDDPYAVISRLGRRLELSGEPATVLSDVVEAVAEALQLPYAAIELTSAEGERLAASHGRGGVIEPDRFPLTYQGQEVGTLLVCPRSAARPFSPTERRLLGDLARQAGVAAHGARLSTALQRSRDRLVRSREEERRRLRRELHDGLGPALAGMTMQIGATRAQVSPLGSPLGDFLTRLEEQLQSCIVEIRRLIDDLRPPTLDDVGLIEGIRRQVSAFAIADSSAPTIAVDASADLGELPAAVEVAAYRIAVEAVTNAVRHAHAHRCDVHISIRDALVVEVADDGVGLPEDHRHGVGLASMRERAEELGGRIITEAAPGRGTRVTARLPLAAP